MQNLAELSIGSKGEIVRISDNSLVQKLLEMGCALAEQFWIVGALAIMDI